MPAFWFVQDPQARTLLDYDGSSSAIQNWYAFGAGPNNVLNQVNVAGSTRAIYIPDIQGSIIASLDASSGTLTEYEAGYQASTGQKEMLLPIEGKGRAEKKAAKPRRSAGRRKAG